ncbi:tRNA adenine-N1-methyltransferase non-catalytic subunit TRM6 [Sarcoptes scabiei]|nr:tRNA adenine-N1-methyltransferase non-catalytic subunit TRM6 [Sarcoptes scabiei]
MSSFKSMQSSTSSPKNETNSPQKSLMNRLIEWLQHWYFIYELRTSLYMLEPWEKKLFSQ